MSAIPLADNRPPRNTAPASDAHGAEKTLKFVADDNATVPLGPQQERLPASPGFDAIDLPASDSLVNSADRHQRTTTRPEAVPFTHTESGLNDLAFDDPDAKSWVADDEDLKERMRGVRNRASELMDWGLQEKIDHASLELLEAFGIENSTATRRMIADVSTKNAPQPWAARGTSQHSSGPDDVLWDPESGQTLVAKLAFLIWDTLIHPATITLALLFFSFRLMIAVVRLSTRPRKHSRRSQHKPPESVLDKPVRNSQRSRSRRRIR